MRWVRLLRPESIAVFGGGAAEAVVNECDRMAFAGRIWPVHPTRRRVGGRSVYRSVAELPAAPDAAYVAVNRRRSIDVVGALAERGAGGAICFASGFAEAGEEGAELQRRLLEAAGDMPLVGPNSYGFVNYVDGAMLWPDQQGGRRVATGVALVTMSSNLAFNLTMQQRGLPIAYVVSLGNRLKFDLHDALRTFARREEVTAIGLHVESVPDPAAFAAAVGLAREAGKPVVAMKSGRSSVAQRMVLSHTASLAGSDELVSALFERSGVARVYSVDALLQALAVLHVTAPASGHRIGVMSPSGGDGSIVSDAAEDTRLVLPPLTERGAGRVRAVAHERVVAANPLDYQMFDWGDERRLTDVFSAFLRERFDVALCVLDYPRGDRCDARDWLAAERALVRVTHREGVRTAVLATTADGMPEPVAARLVEAGVAPLAGVDAGLAAIQAAADVGVAWSRPPRPPPLRHEPPADGRPRRVLDEAASKAWLAEYGVAVPNFRIASSVEEAVAAAERIGYPVAAKALDVAHKTELAAVRLGLGSADAVASAVTALAGISERVLIEEMVAGGVVELIAGIAVDEHFGPHLVVGAGGVLVELRADSRRLLLPTDAEEVLGALRKLRCAPLLDGFRGAPAADVEAAADAVVAIGRLAADRPAVIAELDVNPLIVRAKGHGAVAADALICTGGRSSAEQA